jgi:hypothetical protein
MFYIFIVYLLRGGGGGGDNSDNGIDDAMAEIFLIKKCQSVRNVLVRKVPLVRKW